MSGACTNPSTLCNHAAIGEMQNLVKAEAAQNC